uniref:Bm12869, isoform e n=1 Tax=Brugia malayi TaxID=6279 RepID=A0A1I9G3I1_BRUMA|nr:Bm12869, isoform e [Brugia malayi]
MALLQLKVTRQEGLMCTSLSSLGLKGDIVDVKFVTYQRDEIPESAAEGQVTLLSSSRILQINSFVNYFQRFSNNSQDNRCMFIVFHSTTTQSKCDGLMDSSIVVMGVTRNREARRKQRENPKFREAERARARAYYMSLSSKAPNEGIICGSCGLILKHVEALRAHRAEFHPRQVLCFSIYQD